MQLDRAIALHDYGFNVIALAEREKKPHDSVYRSGNILSIFEQPHTVEQLEQVFSDYPAANIGILTSNCTVVDADCSEAIEFIENNFPPTPLVAKTSKGRHYFYAPSRIGRVTAKQAGGGEAFSIRGPGTCNYVVAPGSIHPSGAEYEWLRFGDLAIDELPAINDMDAKALKNHFDTPPPSVAQVFKPGTGNLGGFDPSLLRTRGEPVDDGDRNNSITSYIGGWIQEGLTEDETLEKALEVNQTFRPPLSESEVTKTHRSVWKTHIGNHPEAEPIEVTHSVKLFNLEQVTEELTDEQLRPPGLLGEFFDWHLSTARFPNKRLAAQSALAFGSVVLGRKYVTSEDNWPSLYFLTVGKSTTGKNHGARTIERALDNAGLSELIGGRGYTSPGAILSALRDKPTHLTIIDEFGDYLEACNAKGNSHRKEAMSVLNEVFSTGDGTLRQSTYSAMGLTEKQRNSYEKINIVCPAVTMYLMTQPERFYDSIGDGDIANGFLGRMIIMDMEAKRKLPAYVKRLPDSPKSVSDWAKNARQRGAGNLSEHIAEVFDLSPEPIEVEITDSAHKVFAAFLSEQFDHQDRLDPMGLGNVVGRMNEMAQRLSCIVACSVNLYQPAVTEKVARWCVDYCRFSFLRMVDAARRNMGGSEYGKLRQQVLNAIVESGSKGMTMRELKRKFRALKLQDLNTALKDLVTSEETALTESKTAGRPRRAFVAVAD